MKKTKFLPFILMPLILAGCNFESIESFLSSNASDSSTTSGVSGGETSSSVQQVPSLAEVVTLETNFRATGQTVLKMDYPEPAGSIYSIEDLDMTVDGYKIKDHLSSKEVIEGDINFMALTLSMMTDSPVSVDDVPYYLSYLPTLGIEVSEEEGIYKIVAGNEDETVYFDFSDGTAFPTIYTKCSISTSENYGKYLAGKDFHASTPSLSIDLEEFAKYDDHFTFDSANSRFAYDVSFSEEDGIMTQGVTIEYFYINLEGGKISGYNFSATVDDEGGEYEVKDDVVFEIGNQTVTLPSGEELGVCNHDWTEEYYQCKYQDKYYHYFLCFNCGFYKDIGECTFDENGVCTVCGNECLQTLYPIACEDWCPVSLYVNEITNKISYIDVDYYFGSTEFSYAVSTLDITPTLNDFDSTGLEINHVLLIQDEFVKYAIVEVTNIETEANGVAIGFDVNVLETQEKIVVSGGQYTFYWIGDVIDL